MEKKVDRLKATDCNADVCANTVQGGYMLFRGIICSLGGLYAVQEGYMDVQENYMLKEL